MRVKPWVKISLLVAVCVGLGVLVNRRNII
jgi:hypothetical protein